MPSSTSPRTPRRAASKPYQRTISSATHTKSKSRDHLNDSSHSPTPSSAGAPSNDGSDFKPNIDELEDIKADLENLNNEDSDDEMIGTPKKKSKGSPKKFPKKVKSNGGSAQSGASGGGRNGAWNGEEDWHLFQAVHPRVSPVWAEVGKGIGRDAKVIHL